MKRALWGAAVAVAATAGLVAITLPLQASGNSGNSISPSLGDGGAGAASGSDGQPGDRPGVVQSGGPGPRTGSGRDGLTPTEAGRARSIASDPAFRAEGEDVHGDRGPEFLRTDLAEQPESEWSASDAPRRAEVYFYDYRDRTLIKRVVNLTTGKVESTDSAAGMQPPPSKDETGEAVRLLLASPLSRPLKTDFRAATDDPLTKPGQLNARGMTYTTADRPGPAALAKCAEHRCVTLFTRVTGGGPWIDATNVVIDLTDRTVSRTD